MLKCTLTCSIAARSRPRRCTTSSRPPQCAIGRPCSQLQEAMGCGLLPVVGIACAYTGQPDLFAMSTTTLSSNICPVCACAATAVNGCCCCSAIPCRGVCTCIVKASCGCTLYCITLYWRIFKYYFVRSIYKWPVAWQNASHAPCHSTCILTGLSAGACYSKQTWLAP